MLHHSSRYSSAVILYVRILHIFGTTLDRLIPFCDILSHLYVITVRPLSGTTSL